MSSFYRSWGYEAPPFDIKPLKAAYESSQLLVGRNSEIERFMNTIYEGPQIVAVEGRFGIGKTSLVNAVAYRLYQNHLADGTNPLILPCIENFQIDPKQSVEDFVDFVYLKIGETLLEHKNGLMKSGTTIDFNGLHSYIESLTFTSVSAGVTGGVVGLQFGHQKQASSSPALLRSGFRSTIKRYLKMAFHYDEGGGILCVLDNVEILNQSSAARMWLEQLRDKLLTVPHLRWVLCDALGILHGVTSSEFFSGLVDEPITLRELRGGAVPAVLTSRIQYYGRGNAYLPLRTEDFVQLSFMVDGSLRWVLSLAHDYCRWISREKKRWVDGRGPVDESEKQSAFEVWLNQLAVLVHDRVKPKMSTPTWDFFQERNILGSRVPHKAHMMTGLSELEYRKQIYLLRDLKLVEITRDELDRRQKNTDLTRDGYLLAWYLNRQKLDSVR